MMGRRTEMETRVWKERFDVILRERRADGPFTRTARATEGSQNCRMSPFARFPRTGQRDAPIPPALPQDELGGWFLALAVALPGP